MDNLLKKYEQNRRDRLAFRFPLWYTNCSQAIGKAKKGDDIMKKIIALTLVLCTLGAFALTGCGKKCDICGKGGAKEANIFGQKVYICDNCLGK